MSPPIPPSAAWGLRIRQPIVILVSQTVQVSAQLVRPSFSLKTTKSRSPPLPFTPQESHTDSTVWNHSRTPLLHLQSSERYKMSQHHINDNTNCFNINNVWNNCTVADEKSEILAWLSPLEPRIRHQDIRTRRVDGVGDWLLQTQEYKDWFGGIHGGKSDSSALFFCGGPGVGKTYMR